MATVEQTPGIEWQKCLGGQSFDYGSSIEQTSDGGYIVAGGSYSIDGNVTGNHGSQDSWVVKLDKSGDVVWEKCLGGSSSDYGSSIEQTSDGGYIVAGFSNSIDGNVTGNHGSQDSWVVKLDESGDLVWQKCLGGSSPDYGNSIEQTSDDGYIFVGFSNSTDGNVTGNHGGKDSWVVKLGESGDVVWEKCLGGSSSDFGSSIEQTSDGGYVVAGGSGSNDGDVTGNHGSQDAWIVKLDESGDVVWQKCLGGSSSESASSIEQTSDGGYIVAGYSNSNDGNVTGNHGSQDSWVVKLDESGDVVWQKCLGGSSIDYGRSIEQISDGGYIFVGYSGSNDGDVTGNHGSHDSWVVKLDESGDVVWQKCLGGSSIDYGRSIEQISDGGYIVAGYSGSNDGDVTGNHGNDDYWVVKLAFQAPVADFSAIPTSGSAPLNVSFIDNSTDNPTSWLWNFDDGANSVEQNPVHTYSTAGNYTVNLTVSNENGTDSKSTIIIVSEKPASELPVANFSTNTTEGYAPLSVQFNDSSENATSVNWDFNGDGISDSEDRNPVYEFTTQGNYSVNLTATNENGEDSKSTIITVFENITALNNSDIGSLTLVNTDFSQLSSIPRGMYIETTSNSAPSNITLAYNSALKCADITYIKPASGNLFFSNLYPATDSNITYTLGTEGVSSSSYLNIIASNSIVAVSKRSSGDYRITSYWIADDKSPRSSYITVPAASITDNKVTFSVVCYESNRTNVLKYNDTIYTKTPFRTMNTRNQNYVFVNQPVVYFSPYLASGDTGPYVVHLYSIKQEIPRKIITPHGTRSISAFTLSYPSPEDNENGTNLMKSNGQKSTVYAIADHLDNATVAYQKALLDDGWELGVYYTINFNSVSNETVIATMDSEYNTIVNKFGRQPETWTALGGSGNISQAIYAYQRYGMIWRSCESGASWLSVGNLCNPYWQWWNTSISQGIVFPAFTIATDKEPVTGSSINASYFTMFSNGFAANNIRLCGLNEYYFTQSAQNTTQVNITDSNNSYMRFTVNTSGYPCTLNVMTNISNVEVSHDGVTVPYTSVDDGIVFTATDDTTYVLRPVSASPVANFTSNLTSGNVPLTVQFNDTSTGSPTSWDWNFGDGTYSNMQNTTHSFTTARIYNVTLTVSGRGRSSAITRSITVSEIPLYPVANFSTNIIEGFAPLTVQFTDLSENATSVNWDFNGDGNSDSDDRNPVYEFTIPGNYTVNLTATNENGTDSTSSTINVLEKSAPVLPVANFSANKTEGFAPLSVQFNDSSENETSVNWDFGDGTNSTEQSPIHTYSATGNYSVNLTASNKNGTASKSGTIIVLEKPVPVFPVANFSANVTLGFAPLSVKFAYLSENADTVSWDFNNDGIADSTERNPVHKYAVPGTYKVNLTVGNTEGRDSKLVTITVLKESEPSVPPVADFSANTTKGYAPLSVKFTDCSEHAVSWSWDFDNDGRTDSSSRNPVYLYPVPGIYTVKLTVTNVDGRNSKITTIKVLEQPEKPVLPEANFSSNISKGYAPLSVRFIDCSEHAVSWSWDFDNNGEADSTSKDPGYVYSTPGIYTVKLTVANENGMDSISDTVTVLERSNTVLPVANFSSNVTEGCAPLTVQFTDCSENAAGIIWDFNGDGTVDSTSRTPVYVYTAQGIYNVNLTAINVNGASSTKTATITVTQESSSSGGSSGSSSGSSSGDSGSSGGSSSVSHSSSGAGGSNEPAKNVEVEELSQAFLTNGKPVKFDFTKNATCIVYMSFDARKTAGKTTSSVEMLKNKSTLTPDAPEGEVYNYLNIWVGNGGSGIEKNLKNAVLCFRVEKSWIRDKGIDPSSIILNRYSDSKWNPLPTRLSEEDGRYLYFTAETPGFSPFAITGKTTVAGTEIKPETSAQVLEQNNESKGANVEQTPDQKESTNTSGKGNARLPGFEVVCGITGLLAIFLSRRK
ncbi:PKD domain-containing protein [Methanosarcina sp.]|uniref:PKD domain-containing protein n=1 Tax=Methanosarcina sp. TaxID=2213 RepID=UPI003C760E9E